MGYFKRTDCNIFIVAAIVVISLSFPARSINGERTVGSTVYCCGMVDPDPNCDSHPGFNCPATRRKCDVSDYCGGICDDCPTFPYTLTCAPCKDDPIECVNQANQLCYGY